MNIKASRFCKTASTIHVYEINEKICTNLYDLIILIILMEPNAALKPKTVVINEAPDSP